jgi:GAF domain-containing protein
MCREKLVGVINVQHRQAQFYSRRDIQLITVIGYLVGAEIKMARLQAENWKSAKELKSLKETIAGSNRDSTLDSQKTP